jgi:excisionase family DNA binding protein
METKYYTPQEVADMFSVKRITVWDWIRKGKLRATRISNRLYRISESQLNRFKEKING